MHGCWFTHSHLCLRYRCAGRSQTNTVCLQVEVAVCVRYVEVQSVDVCLLLVTWLTGISTVVYTLSVLRGIVGRMLFQVGCLCMYTSGTQILILVTIPGFMNRVSRQG